MPIQKEMIQFRALLRKAGYKATPSRLAVLLLFRTARHPLSPQALIEQLGSETDQATIYRTLKTLHSIGAIRQVDFRHNHPHYELEDAQDHHHLICLSCGLSEEITGCDVDSMRQSVLRQTRQFGEIREHALEFYGLCNKCLKKPARLRTVAND